MLDENRRFFAMRNKLVRLTKRETELLLVLIEKNGWCSCKELLEKSNCNSENAIRIVLYRLEPKIAKSYAIRNNRGFGYMLVRRYYEV